MAERTYRSIGNQRRLGARERDQVTGRRRVDRSDKEERTRRPRSRRALLTGAALVVVLVLAGGIAVALSSGDDTESVASGPGGTNSTPDPTRKRTSAPTSSTTSSTTSAPGGPLTPVGTWYGGGPAGEFLIEITSAGPDTYEIRFLDRAMDQCDAAFEALDPSGTISGVDGRYTGQGTVVARSTCQPATGVREPIEIEQDEPDVLRTSSGLFGNARVDFERRS